MKIFIISIIFFQTLFALDYPNKPLKFIVGLGEGGSAYTMSSYMAKFLEKELKVPIKVISIKGNASLDAVKYIQEQKSDAYTIFSTNLYPYLSKDIDKFYILNIQWFDKDFIAVNKNSKFNTLIEIIDYIKQNPKKLKVAVINNSNAYLTFKLLLKEFNIPFDYVDFILFEGGQKARKALIDNKVDILLIAAQGSEKYRRSIKPIVTFSDKRLRRWDAPTINEVLSDFGINIPIITGSIRGIAVLKEVKNKYPKRVEKLEKAIKKVLSTKKVQQFLKQRNIGYIWLGNENSEKILKQAYQTFKKYHFLIDNQK